MGNQPNKKQTNIEIELNHSKINIIHVINDAQKRYMQAVFGVEQLDYKNWKTKLEKSKSSNQYLLLPIKHQFSSKALCGTAGSVKVDYENYPYLLIEQIENRRAKKKRFDETELWFLLYCLLDAQKQMRNGNLSKVGDIRPHNIFINQESKIKVANLLSWPGQGTNYQKFLQNQVTYLAPEDMKSIQQSQISNDGNKQSQIFSIGLTLLSVANLTDYKYLYKTKESAFNLEQFQRVINEWRTNEYYSDILKATLCSLVQVNVDQRETQLQVQPWIKLYKNDILTKNDFVINDPPKKIIQQVELIRRSSNIFAPYHQPHLYPSVVELEQKKVFSSIPLQGSRRLVEERRLPPISVIPGTSTTESIYAPVENSNYLSNFLLQGAPITSSNPIFANRINFNSGEKTQSTFSNQISTQGGAYVPKTAFEYSSSPEGNRQVDKSLQNSPERLNKQQSNQPQIIENSKPTQEQNTQH